MKIEIKGLKIHYEMSGKGRDMVLLHGWGCSVKHFEKVHEYYKEFFRVFRVDIPGFGESDEPGTVWGNKEYGDFFREFIEKLGIQNPIVMGHSNGGRMAIYNAEKVPYHKLILIDSAGIKPKRSLKYYLKIYSYKIAKRFAKLPGLKQVLEPKIEAYRRKVSSADYKAASGIMRGVMSKLLNEDLKGLLPTITAPTLLIWGGKDTATPLEDGKLMEKLIPDAGLVVFENAGHFSYLEEFDRFIIVINSFLRKEMEELHES